MKKILENTYKIICLVFLLLILYAMLQLRVYVNQPGWRDGYVLLQNVERTKVQDASAPVGQTEIYRFSLNDIRGDYNTLFFYTVHQNIRVYAGEECIYALQGSDGKISWRSTGRIWNEVTLTEEENGEEIRIEVQPVYENARDLPILIYFGCRFDMMFRIIRADLPNTLLSLIVIVTGICYLCIEWIRRRNGGGNDGLLFYGMFFIIIGLWKMTSASVIGLAADSLPALSMIQYWMLLALSIPYLAAIRYSIGEKDNPVWNVFYIISLINIWGVLLLQFLGVADMRETQMPTQMTICLEMVIGLFMALRKLLQKKRNKEIRFTLLFCVCTIFWLAFDMVTYYVSGRKQTSLVGIMGFMVYLLALAVDSAKNARQLMTVGMQARQYEKIAFHDQLTGFYNRAAYAEYIGNEEFSPEECIIAMFDLNNLKKCNDTLGHDKGDEYIRESARIIRECFGDIGQCYRVGGDEFCAIISKSSKEVCQRRLEELLVKVENYNKRNKDIHMGIACGFEQFDKEADQDIEDTAKRADQMMYQHKFKIKKEMAAAGISWGEQSK